MTDEKPRTLAGVPVSIDETVPEGTIELRDDQSKTLLSFEMECADHDPDLQEIVLRQIAAGKHPHAASATVGRDPLTQKQVDTLVGIFASGFISGVTTLMMASHKHCPDADCGFPTIAENLASNLAHGALEDPAFRLDLANDLERRWHDPSYTREMHAFTVHTAKGDRG